MANPLREYRLAQRALRKEFAPFTARYCPICPTPCCVRPAQIIPTDLLLAEAIGWKSQVADAVGDQAAAAAVTALDALVHGVDFAVREPCEHLGPTGCTFPSDLRPFGCTTYICPIMHRELDAMSLRRTKRLVRDLERKHAVLMAFLHRSQQAGSPPESE